MRGITNQYWTTARGVIITPKSLEGKEISLTRPTAKEAKLDLWLAIQKFVLENSRAKKVKYRYSTKVEAGVEHFSRFDDYKNIERYL